jgi:hypothetical protein
MGLTVDRDIFISALGSYSFTGLDKIMKFHKCDCSTGTSCPKCGGITYRSKEDEELSGCKCVKEID